MVTNSGRPTLTPPPWSPFTGNQGAGPVPWLASGLGTCGPGDGREPAEVGQTARALMVTGMLPRIALE